MNEPPTPPPHDAWVAAVARYLDELETLAADMQTSMDGMRIGVTERGPAAITPAVIELAKRVDRLQTFVVRRDELLTDPAAPLGGLTLRAKLQSLGSPSADALADRCRGVGETVAETHGRATSLFVCQFHLSELTSDLVRTLNRRRGGETYDRSGQRRGPTIDGSVMDRAA